MYGKNRPDQSSWSLVGPPLVGGWDGGAAVLDRDAAKRVVLALRMTLPVVRHLDPGQRRVTVEDKAEEVPGFPLVPVVGRVDVDKRRHMRVGIRSGDLKAQPAVLGDRQQVIDRVEFTADLHRVVRARDSQTQLEPESGVIAQPPRDLCEVVAADVERHLAISDDHPLYGVTETEP